MKALIIIDMQVGLFTEDNSRFDSINVINRINKLSDIFRSQNDKVILIQHDGPKGDIFEPNTVGWKFLPGLDRNNTDTVINKTICDAFYETGLEKVLKQKQN